MCRLRALTGEADGTEPLDGLWVEDRITIKGDPFGRRPQCQAKKDPLAALVDGPLTEAEVAHSSSDEALRWCPCVARY
jgi:hypothetical protein